MPGYLVRCHELDWLPRSVPRAGAMDCQPHYSGASVTTPDGVVIDFLNDNHEVITRFVISDHPSAREAVHTVQIPNDFLVSAGQPFEALVRLRHLKAKPPRVLSDATHTPACVAICAHVPHTWDYRWIPSNRPLWAIMQDIVDHGKDFPRHGPGCSCLDRFLYEMKHHISRAVSMVPPDSEGTGEEYKAVMDGRARIAHVLRLVGRWL